MCGIAGIHIKPSAKGKVPAGRLLDWLLLGIEPRGGDATGFLSVGFDNAVQMDKNNVKAPEFIKARKPMKSMPQTVLAHTRLATQGSPDDNRNNHPVHFGTVFLVHNGWLTNDVELFKEHGLEPTAEVDTLAIAAMLWEQAEDGFLNGAPKALEEIEGAMAIAAIDIQQPGKVLLARGFNSPLVYIETNDFWMWASTKSALKLAWGKVFGTPPKDKRFKELEEGKFILLDNGNPTFGEFKPAWGTRYSGSTIGSYWNDHEYGYSSYGSMGASSSGSGYWVVNEDGTRTYKSVGAIPATGAADYTTPLSRANLRTSKPFKPLDYEIKAVEALGTWAVDDGQYHEAALWVAADNVGIDFEVARWLLFYCDPDVIKSDRKLMVVRDALDWEYAEMYKAMMQEELDKAKEAEAAEAQMTITLDPSAVSEEDREVKLLSGPLACVECGFNSMEEDGYCSDCLNWREQQVAL